MSCEWRTLHLISSALLRIILTLLTLEYKGWFFISYSQSVIWLQWLKIRNRHPKSTFPFNAHPDNFIQFPRRSSAVRATYVGHLLWYWHLLTTVHNNLGYSAFLQAVGMLLCCSKIDIRQRAIFRLFAYSDIHKRSLTEILIFHYYFKVPYKSWMQMANNLPSN